MKFGLSERLVLADRHTDDKAESGILYWSRGRAPHRACASGKKTQRLARLQQQLKRRCC
ncbi:MAG: hypothetical protein LH632_11605 [Rhodoferax sp.]|nr:hypothetical protein [Rhodoferax sp.]